MSLNDITPCYLHTLPYSKSLISPLTGNNVKVYKPTNIIHLNSKLLHSKKTYLAMILHTKVCAVKVYSAVRMCVTRICYHSASGQQLRYGQTDKKESKLEVKVRVSIESKENRVMKTGEQVNIFVGSEEISRVTTCKVLEAVITKDEIKRRISLGKPAMVNLIYIMKDSRVPTNTTVKMAQTMVFPAVLYRCRSGR